MGNKCKTNVHGVCFEGVGEWEVCRPQRLGLLQVETVDDAAEVGGEKFDTDGQQDDTKEFAQDGYEGAAQDVFEFVDVAEHQIVDADVDEQCNKDVDVAVFGSERDDGGESPGSGNEREGYGHHGRAAVAGIVFEDLHSQYHLEGHDEKDYGARYGKRLDVDAEELQGGIAQKEEDDKNQQRDECGVEGMEFVAAVLE